MCGLINAQKVIKIAFNEDIAKYTNVDSLIIESYKELGYEVDSLIVPYKRQQLLWERNQIDAFGLRVSSVENKNFKLVKGLYLPLEIRLWGEAKKDSVVSLKDDNLNALRVGSHLMAKRIVDSLGILTTPVMNVKTAYKMIENGHSDYLLNSSVGVEVGNKIYPANLVPKSKILGIDKMTHFINVKYQHLIPDLQKILANKMKYVKVDKFK